MSFAKLPVLRHGLTLRREDIFTEERIAGRVARVRALMAEKGVGSLIVYSSPANNGAVCFLSNYPNYATGRQATVVLGMEEGPFLYTNEPARNIPKVRCFTFCDLEKGRKVIEAACARARELAASGRVGVVGSDYLPSKNSQQIEEILGRDGLLAMTEEFASMMAAKDAAALEAIGEAVKYAHEGFRFFAGKAESGENLWQLAAETDYSLRREGCESINILAGCGGKKRVRPGMPATVVPGEGDTVAAYVAVQNARYWGGIGRTLRIGPSCGEFDKKLAALKKVRAGLEGEALAGTRLGELQDRIRKIASEAGAELARDLPIVEGVGFDPMEYPFRDGDSIENGMVLQVVLAADSDSCGTVFLADLLQVTAKGGVWLTCDGVSSDPV